MEYNEPQKNNFKERVLKRIEADDVKAYSKAHFALRMMLLIVVSILILLVSICLFSYICFSVRMSGHGSLSGPGQNGILTFLQFFPWTQLAIDIILVGLLQWLLRKFRFGYHIPVLHLLCALLIVTGATGYVVYRETGFNEMLLQQAEQNHLPPPLENLYKNLR
jgi:hypothetical protein